MNFPDVFDQALPITSSRSSNMKKIIPKDKKQTGGNMGNDALDSLMSNRNKSSTKDKQQQGLNISGNDLFYCDDVLSKQDKSVKNSVYKSKPNQDFFYQYQKSNHSRQRQRSITSINIKKQQIPLEQQTFGLGLLSHISPKRRQSKLKQNKQQLFGDKLQPPPSLIQTKRISTINNAQKDNLKETIKQSDALQLPFLQKKNKKNISIIKQQSRQQKQKPPLPFNRKNQHKYVLSQWQISQLTFSIRSQCQKQHQQQCKKLFQNFKQKMSFQKQQYKQLISTQKENSKQIIQQLNNILKQQRTVSKQMIINQRLRLKQLQTLQNQRYESQQLIMVQQIKNLVQRQKASTQQMLKSYQIAKQALSQKSSINIVRKSDTDQLAIKTKQAKLQANRQQFQRYKEIKMQNLRSREQSIRFQEHKNKMALLDETKRIQAEKTRIASQKISFELLQRAQIQQLKSMRMQIKALQSNLQHKTSDLANYNKKLYNQYVLKKKKGSIQKRQSSFNQDISQLIQMSQPKLKQKRKSKFDLLQFARKSKGA